MAEIAFVQREMPGKIDNSLILPDPDDEVTSVGDRPLNPRL